MKFIILKENLKNALSAVERVVTENNNLPILRNVLLKADSHIKVAATNLEIGVTCLTAGKITENGSLTIPFAPLYNIISGSDSERINIITDKNTLIIKTDNYEAKIQGVNEEEFPIIPKIENNNHYFEIEGQVFKESIQQIISAAQFSEIKPELSGVLFDFQVTALKLVATDSFRLAEKIITKKTELEQSIIIPRFTVQEVVRIFGDKEGEVSLSISENQIFFFTTELEVVSRLIDGHYPDYKKVIPEKFLSKITVKRSELEKGVRLASIFSSTIADIKIQTEKEGLKILAKNTDKGEVSSTIKGNLKGANFAVAVNFRYILDGVKVMTAENITLEFTGEGSPLILKVEDHKDFLYLIMPLRS